MATERGAGFGLTEAEATELQRRMRWGETHVEAASGGGLLREDSAAAVAPHGGISPRWRPRAPLRLSLAEREEISRGLLAKDSRRVIADEVWFQSRRRGRAITDQC
jgi:hypothetical protein